MNISKIKESDVIKGGYCGGFGDGYIYFLIKNGKVMYVGQTITLSKRSEQHKKSGKDFDLFSYVNVEIEDLDNSEAHLIFNMEPPLNRTMPSNDHFISTKALFSLLCDDIKSTLKDDDDVKFFGNGTGCLSNKKTEEIRAEILRALKRLQ